MELKTKALIDSLPKEDSFCEKCDGSGRLRNNRMINGVYTFGKCDCDECDGTGILIDGSVKLSYVIELVDKLTKWNDVYDELPDCGVPVNVKFNNGSVCMAYYLSHKYRDCMFYSYCEPDIEFILEDVIEWKLI